MERVVDVVAQEFRLLGHLVQDRLTVDQDQVAEVVVSLLADHPVEVTTESRQDSKNRKECTIAVHVDI